jgi:hypothetical protein
MPWISENDVHLNDVRGNCNTQEYFTGFCLMNVSIPDRTKVYLGYLCGAFPETTLNAQITPAFALKDFKFASTGPVRVSYSLYGLLLVVLAPV